MYYTEYRIYIYIYIYELHEIADSTPISVLEKLETTSLIHSKS